MALDCDVLRDIPSYRKILKVVLKSQIQTLVQQLFEHTGEESVLLSANLSNQSLSHLGSDSGKAFLKECSDIKAKFLSFCAKRSTGSVAAPVNPSTTTVSLGDLNNIPFTRKPYNRLQRRYSRLGSGGKQGLNAAYRTKERHLPYVSTMSAKSREQADLTFSPEVQGHSEVAEVPVSVADSSELPETSTDVEATVVKIERADSLEETAEEDNSSNVSMETEKSPEGGENFQYVLNADLIESPWKQSDDQSASVANQSKRKQTQPIRITKTASSMEGGAENDDTPNKESQSDLDYSYDDAESSPMPQLLGNKGDIVPFANHGGGLIADSQESPSSGYTWTEEKPQSNTSTGKAYMKTPQIDGIFVSRGLGRYEKLIRCEICGKVCRTSNMARHKRRYCTAMSSNTPAARRRHGSPRDKWVKGESSDIYIDNPMELSLDSAQEMNGSGMEGTAEGDEQGTDGVKHETDQENEDLPDPCNVVIKQEPISYEEN